MAVTTSSPCCVWTDFDLRCSVKSLAFHGGKHHNNYLRMTGEDFDEITKNHKELRDLQGIAVRNHDLQRG